MELLAFFCFFARNNKQHNCANHERNTDYGKDYSTGTARDREQDATAVRHFNGINTGGSFNLCIGKVHLYGIVENVVTRGGPRLDKIVVVICSVCLILCKGGGTVSIGDKIALQLDTIYICIRDVYC